MAKRERLTEDRVKKLKAPTTDGKPQVYRDSVVRYLAVLCSGHTTRKSYVISYGTRFQRRAIGDVTEITLDYARQEALRMQGLMKKGIDPNSETPRATPTQTTTITLKELLDRRVNDDKQPLRAASVKCYTNVTRRHFADWLDKPIADITLDQVHDRHKLIFKNVPKSEGQDGRTMADMAMRILGGLFVYAKGLKGSDRIIGLPDANPVAGIEWYVTKRQPCSDHISDTDLPRFWGALSGNKLNPVHGTMIRVMLLTGLRIGTARQLKWPMIDLDNRAIKIPAELMKGNRPHELPIVPGLFEILADWRKRGIERSGYVFPSSIRGKHATDLTMSFRLIEKATGVKASAHDCRRTFARAGKKAKVSRWQMADLLHHSAGTITDGYSGTLEADDLREPMQAVVDHILKFCWQEGDLVVVFDPNRRKAA